jgi:hypothetical protein
MVSPESCPAYGSTRYKKNNHTRHDKQNYPPILAHRREQWGRFIRSTARGAVSLKRLQADANGALLDTFPPPWSDGTTGITRSPLARLETLAALVPLPRVPRRPLCRLPGAAQPPT